MRTPYDKPGHFHEKWTEGAACGRAITGAGDQNGVWIPRSTTRGGPAKRVGYCWRTLYGSISTLPSPFFKDPLWGMITHIFGFANSVGSLVYRLG